MRLNSEKRFFASRSILHDEDFSEYVKNLFKVQESDNHLATNILSIMNMTEIKFKNIDSLRTKAWNNFPSPVRLMMPWMTVYDNTDVITSVLDGNVFLAARTLSTNKINIFSVIDGKCIFLFTS